MQVEDNCHVAEISEFVKGRKYQNPGGSYSLIQILFDHDIILDRRSLNTLYRITLNDNCFNEDHKQLAKYMVSKREKSNQFYYQELYNIISKNEQYQGREINTEGKKSIEREILAAIICGWDNEYDKLLSDYGFCLYDYVLFKWDLDQEIKQFSEFVRKFREENQLDTNYEQIIV